MKKRLNNLSIYRLVATICILQFHLFFILYNRAIPYETLLSKGVQGLTALSGFLYSQKLITDYKKFYFGNLKKILVPAAVCLGVMAIWNLIYMFVMRDWNYIGLFFGHRAYNNGLLVQPGNYYYIGYIFLCYLITPLLQRNDKWTVVAVVSTVAIELAVGYFWGPSIIATSYVVGYFVGKKWFKQLTDTETKFSVSHLLIWLGITAASVGIYIVLVEFSFSNGYGLTHLQDLLRNIMLSTFGVSSFFLIIHALRWTNKLPAIKPLMFTDKLTLIIYLFNQAFMCGAMDVSAYVGSIWAKTILVYIITIAFSVIVHFISTFILKPRSKTA